MEAFVRKNKGRDPAAYQLKALTLEMFDSDNNAWMSVGPCVHRKVYRGRQAPLGQWNTTTFLDGRPVSTTEFRSCVKVEVDVLGSRP